MYSQHKLHFYFETIYNLFLTIFLFLICEYFLYFLFYFWLNQGQYQPAL